MAISGDIRLSNDTFLRNATLPDEGRDAGLPKQKMQLQVFRYQYTFWKRCKGESSNVFKSCYRKFQAAQRKRIKSQNKVRYLKKLTKAFITKQIYFLVKMLREELTYGQQGKSRLHTGRTMVKHRESGQQRDEGRKPAVSLRVSRTPYCRKKWKSPSKRERNQSGQHGIIIWANDWWQHQEAVKP